MARYTGPMTKKSRRLGVDLVGGDMAFERRPFPPGQHGRGRAKESEYLLQLREKQKARRVYGILEKQFRGYYEEAVSKPGKTGEVLLQILESRLDNAVDLVISAHTHAAYNCSKNTTDVAATSNNNGGFVNGTVTTASSARRPTNR